MGCSVPELPAIDLIALGERVATALKTIVENTPGEMANLYTRIKEAPDQKLVVKKKEMLGGTEDVTLTMDKTGENAQAVTVCALKISAKGTFVSDLQWAVWVEMTREVMWAVMKDVPWPCYWFGMRAGRKASDAAVEKAVEEGIAKACEKFKSEPVAAKGDTGAATGGKVEVKGKEGGSAQVAPAAEENKPAA